VFVYVAFKHDIMDVRRTRLSTASDKAFPVAAARLWNVFHHTSLLPPHLSPSSAVPFLTFLSHFLTFLSFASVQAWACHRQWTDEYDERPETLMRQNDVRPFICLKILSHQNCLKL